MGKKKINLKKEELKQRIHELRNDPEFLSDLNDIKNSPNAKQFFAAAPLMLDRLKMIERDESKKQNIYSGLHYDLAALAERYGLHWPDDSEYIYRLLESEESLEKLLNADDLTDKKSKIKWQVWRMARFNVGGFSHPREDELSRMTKTPRPNALSIGLTRDEIIDFLNNADPKALSGNKFSQENTISRWTKICRDYLLGGGDPMVAYEMADLEQSEFFELFKWIEMQRNEDGKPINHEFFKLIDYIRDRYKNT